MDINSILANEVNKNAVVNTFTKGMNTDTSDSMMPSDQYRAAENLRLITHDNGNNGELSLIEGYSKIYDSFVNIAAATLIRQYGIVVDRQTEVEVEVPLPGGGSATSIEPADYWNIFRITYNDSNDQYTVQKIFGPCLDPLGDAVSLVTRYEDNDNVKLYIADGKHPLMMINIADPTNVSSPSTSINSISSFPEHRFDRIELNQLSSGSLLPAAVQYAYLLYNKYGNNSGISPLSVLQPVVNRSSGSSIGLEYGDKTGSGYKVTVRENKTSGYDKCKIYRITYQQIGLDPTVNMIYDGDLNDSSNLEYSDYGTDITSLSYAEFLALQKIPVVFTEIESKNDYLFGANVKYQITNSQELLQLFDALDFTAQIEDNDYLNMSSRFKDDLWRSYSAQYSIMSWKLVETEYTGGRALRHNELYRFGIVLYDKYGNAWPVKWICDVRTPIGNTQLTLSGNSYINDYSANRKVTLLKIDFTINLSFFKQLLGSEFEDYFTNFEIVRCKRDETRHVISRGIIGRPLLCYKYGSNNDYELSYNSEYPDASTYAPVGEDTKVIVPSGFLTTKKMVVYPGSESDYTYGVSSDKFLLFASPEICYQEDDVENLLKNHKNFLELQTVYRYTNVLDVCTRKVEANYYLHPTYSAAYIWNEPAYYIKSSLLSPNNTYTGINFSKDRYDRDGTGTNKYYVVPSTSVNNESVTIFNNMLWVSTRHFFPYHEPLAYNQQIVLNVQQTVIDGTTYYDAHSIVHDNKLLTYYSHPNDDVYMRKTIYNKITKDLNQYVEDCSYSKGTGGNNGNNSYPVTKQKINIQDFISIKTPKYDEFSEEDTPTFRNNSQYLSEYEFIPWSIPTNFTMQDFSGYYGRPVPVKSNSDASESYDYWAYVGGVNREANFYPVSIVGKSILLDVSNNTSLYLNSDVSGVTPDLYITVCDLCNKNDGDRYGGYTDYARRSSTYYSFGDYYGLNATDTDNNIDYINISVTSGDCYLRMFYYNAAKTFYTDKARYAPNMTTVYQIPIETDIEINFETGYSSKNQGAEYNLFIQDEPATLRGYSLTKPCYIANTAYNTNETAKYFTGQDKDDLENVNYDYRVCYSNLKLNNESFDSWLSFKSANYIDVDTRYGQITDLRLFKDTLLFWLDNAVGVLSVNERTIIQDANDTNIILGNGDVLQRYDYLTTEYGMKPNQYADGQSNTTLYWWDGYKREILSYSGGLSVTPMNKLKTIDNYINSRDEFAYPSIAYDVKYNEVLFSVVGDYTLAYSEVVQQFISDYNVQFKHRFNFYDKLMLLDDTKMYEWNKSPQNSTLKPYLKFVVNPQTLYNNVYDIMQIAGRLYGGNTLTPILMVFKTPLKQEARLSNGAGITNREYDFRLDIPRAGAEVTSSGVTTWKTADWGDRMRGKVMECELSTTSSDPDFSLQYIITKYRKSWI